MATIVEQVAKLIGDATGLHCAAADLAQELQAAGLLARRQPPKRRKAGPAKKKAAKRRAKAPACKWCAMGYGAPTGVHYIPRDFLNGFDEVTCPNKRKKEVR